MNLTQIERHEPLREIGHDGLRVCVRGHDLLRDQPVVLMVVPWDRDLDAARKQEARLTREPALLQGRLIKRVVQVFDGGDIPARLPMVLPRVGDATGLTAVGIPFKPIAAAAFGRSLADANSGAA